MVYEALDRPRGVRVALKTLQRVSADGLLRFKTEFRAVQDVHHPNLVTLGELIEDGGQWWLTMELVEGAPFLDHVRPGGRLDERRLRAALPQLAAGLSALHAHGLVLRDVKPHNVLVTSTGRVVLLDFGLVAKQHEQPRRPGELASVPDDLDALCMQLLATDPVVRLGAVTALAGLDRDAAVTSPAAALAPSPVFIGRQRELASLTDAFAGTRAGAEAIVLVEGESASACRTPCGRGSPSSTRQRGSCSLSWPWRDGPWRPSSSPPRACSPPTRSIRPSSGSAKGIEPYHDRVREAVLDHVDPDLRKTCHRALARALLALGAAPEAPPAPREPEGTGAPHLPSSPNSGDASWGPEAVAVHLHAAGDLEQAARYMVLAADQAGAALAFDRAARLYRQALAVQGELGAAVGPLSDARDVLARLVNRFLSDMLLFKNGPIHTCARSLIGKAFTSKAVETLRPFIQKTVDALASTALEWSTNFTIGGVRALPVIFRS